MGKTRLFLLICRLRWLIAANNVPKVEIGYS